MTSYSKPSEREFQRLCGRLNTTPCLTNDGGDEIILKGVFNADGELVDASVRPEDKLNDARGVVVPIKSHTDTVGVLKQRWSRNC